MWSVQVVVHLDRGGRAGAGAVGSIVDSCLNCMRNACTLHLFYYGTPYCQSNHAHIRRCWASIGAGGMQKKLSTSGRHLVWTGKIQICWYPAWTPSIQKIINPFQSVISMHMKFSTCTENTWAINKSFLSYPSKTNPYSLETVSMATVHNFMYFVFSRLTRSN